MLRNRITGKKHVRKEKFGDFSETILQFLNQKIVPYISTLPIQDTLQK